MFENQIASIDLSKNIKVTQLLIEYNKLTSIDVSKLTVLTDLKAHSNLLTEANIANRNNSNMTRMELHYNDDLKCIKVDELPVPESGWSKSAGDYNTTGCAD